MIEKERSPALRRRSPSPRHILSNRSLTDIDAELEKFSMNAGSAPERISEAHLADQPTDFARHLRPATSPSGLPSPEGPKTCAVPAEDSFGLNDRECIENAWCDPIEQHEDQPIAYVERSLFRCAPTQHVQLLAKHDYLRLERAP